MFKKEKLKKIYQLNIQFVYEMLLTLKTIKNMMIKNAIKLKKMKKKKIKKSIKIGNEIEIKNINQMSKKIMLRCLLSCSYVVMSAKLQHYKIYDSF